MTAHAQRIRLRLFIEGIEIPVVSANVSAAPNSPGVATIQITPLAEATRLLPRSVVHLFFLDMYITQSPFLTSTTRGESPNEQNPTAYEQRKEDAEALGTFFGADDESTQDAEALFGADRANARYKVLFMGEIVGWTWTKTATQRSIVLQCEDFSNYWDYAYQWSNTGLFGPGIKAIFSGGATNLHTDFLSTKSEAVMQLLNGKSARFPQLSGLASGIVRLIEGIGGTYFPPPGSGAKRIAGQNIFFSLAELRLKISHMVGAVQDDATSKALLARRGYEGMFSRALGGLGAQTSIRQAINALTKIIFHEIYPQPCPLFIPGTGGDVQGTKLTKLKDHPKWGPIVTVAEQSIEGVNGVKRSLERLIEQTGIPEFARDDVPSTIQDVVQKLASIEKALKGQLYRLRGAPKPAEKIFSIAAAKVGKARTRTARFRPDAPDSVTGVILRTLDGVVETLTPALELTTVERAGKDSQPAQVYQHIFRPDIWFSAPPRCNVLFPESYFQLLYRRAFLQEPTRFLLKTNDEFFGEDFLFDQLYFAPQAGSTASKEHARLKEMLQNTLLDHELYTGILPIFEKMGEFNIFASKSAGADGVAGVVAKVGAAQRSANFIFFKHRFNARRMQIRCKFNPYIAVGCPGLIIDSHVDVATMARYNELKEKIVKSDTKFASGVTGQDVEIGEDGLGPQQLSELLGTNFLGNFTQITHAVSQQDAQSSSEIVCSYPRQSEEGIEFLGAIPEAQKVKKKSEDAAVRTTAVAAMTAPQLFSLGPNMGRITNVHDVTARYTTPVTVAGERVNEAGKLKLFDPKDPQRTTRNPIEVPIGPIFLKELPAAARSRIGELIDEESDAQDVEILIRAFVLTEEVARYRRQDTLIPAEEFIRPGWYGDVWSSAKIGKVYGELFGTGAITDQQTVTGPTGKTTSSQSEDQLSALEEAEQAEEADDARLLAPALVSLEEGATIQDAVEFLQLTYSYIRQAGLDIEEFIRAYTWRPIATMVDIFGTSDLKFTQDGSRVVSGIEGFHSRAFGPYENLFGLADPQIEDIIGIKDEFNNRKVDTRLRKYKAVQKYVSAIRFSRALLG